MIKIGGKRGEREEREGRVKKRRKRRESEKERRERMSMSCRCCSHSLKAETWCMRLGGADHLAPFYPARYE